MKMSKEEKAGYLVGVIGVVVILGLLIGWVRNIVIVSQSDFGEVTGFLVVRIIGILVAPIGAVLGWF